MITELLALVGSPAIGGLFGFVGAYLTKREERATLKITFENEQKMAEITANNKLNQTTLEGEVAERRLDAESFFASQKYGDKNSGNSFVDAAKSFMRPLITTYLLVVITYITYQINSFVGGVQALTPTELLSLYKEIILSLLALTNMSIAWWFGSRPSSIKK